MADVQPFRAVRYAGAAGALADLVAPPYDAVSADERAELYLRSPYNVVHVTLPDSAEEGGAVYREWVEAGTLVEDDASATWILAETYVGPDGVSRERHGLIVSLEAEPYETGGILPHERTRAHVRDERLALLRATGVQPEPILVLAETPLAGDIPAEPPELEANDSRLWRIAPPDVPAIDAPMLLIADGHHRYEAAVALGAERGVQARIMALVVSTTDPGLQVFPTHRVFSGRPDLAASREGETCGGLDDALARLAEEPPERAAAVAYRAGSVELVRGDDRHLDVELVYRHGLDGIGYTQDAAAAASAVDRGTADAAYLVRAPRVEDVFAAARRGERMPPKSTYFFPKPLAGLLFHPVFQPVPT
jgi:uncharacterized protein (DUF1015 family)